MSHKSTQVKDDICYDLERPLKIISGMNSFIVCTGIYSVYSVRSQLQRSDVICEQYFYC